MPAPTTRLLLAGLVAVMAVACASTVTGTPVRSAPGLDEDSRSPIDVDALLLEPDRMRAITGGGNDLTAIPSMDGKQPVDVDTFVDLVPPQCGWLFAETQTFGPDVEEFHKITYQNPPLGALISQGAAAYRDAATARRALGDLIGRITDCGSSTSGYVGDWTVGDATARTRTSSECGRDYRLKSVVLVEVTFCAYPASVPDIVMTNLLAKVPG